MSIAYPPDLQDFVRAQINSGEFHSEEEFAVFAAALYRDLQDRHEELRQHVVGAISEIDRGEGIEIDGIENMRHFLDDLKAQGRERLKSVGAGQ